MQLPANRWPILALLTASGLARLSDQMAGIVYGYGMLRETGNSLSGGLVLASSFAALVLGSLFAGRLIARFGARPIALAGSWLSVAAAAMIAVLVGTGHGDPLMIAMLAAAGAVLDGPSAIASELHYPQVARLGRMSLIKLNAIDDGLDSSATLVAPACGVVLVSMAGLAGGAFAVLALGLLGALSLTAGFPRFGVIRGASAVTLSMVFQTIRQDRLLLNMTVLFSIAVAVYAALQLVVLPRLLYATAGNGGLLMLFLVAGGLAALGGAALSHVVAVRVSLRVLLTVAFLMLAVGAVLPAASTATPVIMLSAVLCGLPTGVIAPLAASIYQLRPPLVLRADVQSVAGALVFAVAPLAVLASSFAVDVLPAAPVAAVLAVLIAASAVFAALVLPPSTAQAAMAPFSGARPESPDVPDEAPVPIRPGRSSEVDALRGVALFGIIVVNAPFFAAPLNSLHVESWPDAFAVWLTGALFAGKFFLIFSFLFGFGFATLLARAAREGTDIRSRFLRRLLALFAFGALHACFLFAGDILMLYAALGLVLWFCRHWSRRSLLIAASLAYLLGAFLQVVALWAILLEASGGLAPAVTPGAAYLGGFLDVAAARIAELPSTLAFVLFFNGLPALAMFFAGLALGREGAFPPPPEKIKTQQWGYGAALVIGACVSGIAMLVVMSGSQASPALALTVLVAAAPALSYGLAGTALVLIHRHAGSPLVRWLGRSGGSSLTGYILHSVLLGAVFYGWGLGLYGALGTAAILAVAVAVFAVIVLSLNIWRRFFRYGPDEWLMRCFIDLAWKPIRN